MNNCHRDGSYSFYLADPDHIVIQILYEPRISAVRFSTATLDSCFRRNDVGGAGMTAEGRHDGGAAPPLCRCVAVSAGMTPRILLYRCVVVRCRHPL